MNKHFWIAQSLFVSDILFLNIYKYFGVTPEDKWRIFLLGNALATCLYIIYIFSLVKSISNPIKYLWANWIWVSVNYAYKMGFGNWHEDSFWFEWTPYFFIVLISLLMYFNKFDAVELFIKTKISSMWKSIKK